MDEAQIRNNVIHRLRTKKPQAVVIRHEDHFARGNPDTSLSLDARTSWWEFKHQGLLEDFPLVQQITLQELSDTQVPAYYALVTPDNKRFHLLNPHDLGSLERRPYSPDMVAMMMLRYHYEYPLTGSPMRHFKMQHRDGDKVPKPEEHFEGVVVHHTEIQRPLVEGLLPTTMTVYYIQGEPSEEYR